MEALGNLGINLSYLVVQILNFFIVMSVSYTHLTLPTNREV